jgi:D-alanyl-D-alanine carboxypeptidase/D-alanyl-D-alanine carboxypeptidase (penicillin-binding protein 5/6)
MASTTKIMTAVVAIEGYDLDTNVKIPAAAVGIEGSSIYLCEGEELTLRQLLYALLLSSANDSATAIALHCAGSAEAFADMMNDTARRLGLINTHFDNPHGLDSDSHYTTARDLAKLAAYALTLNEFKTISSTYKTQIPLAGTENARLLVNHNKLLRSYEGIIGVKTGFTKKSGRCLVSAAERDGIILVAVTLNAPDDWADHRAMLDFGFDNYTAVELTKGISPLPLPVISGDTSLIQCAPREQLSAILPKDHGTILCRIEMDRFAYAPVEQNEVVGKIYYFCDGRELGCTDIITLQGTRLKKQKYTIWDRISDFFTK